MKYATRLSAGLDLHTQEDFTVKAHSHASVKVGKIDLMNVDYLGNVVGLVMPKSGLSVKHNIVARLGVIDMDFSGDIVVTLDNFGNRDYAFENGDKVAQLVVVPFCHLYGYDIDDKERGANGFGSTGK